MTPGLFFTGTGTGVGKTYVTALVAQSLTAAGVKVGVYKPVASGCRHAGNSLLSDDAVALWNAAGQPGTLEQVCPQRFAAPLAPHLAAKAEGKQIDAELLRTGLKFWQANSEIVLVEGAGGLMSPLTEDEYNADLAADFEYPLVVVAANVLGTINATLQTLITTAAFGNGLPVAGVVLNHVSIDPADQSTNSNWSELRKRCVSPLLAQVAHGANAFSTPVDWLALAGPVEESEADEDFDE